MDIEKEKQICLDILKSFAHTDKHKIIFSPKSENVIVAAMIKYASQKQK